MTLTILFGGTSKERLVSVASAQALAAALPEAELWFWQNDDTVHVTDAARLQAHERPFEIPYDAEGRQLGLLAQALDRAARERRTLVLGLHGGRAENGELQAMCAVREIAYTGSDSASSHLAFDKIAAKRFAAFAGVEGPQTIALQDIEAALAHHGRLIAKPARDGSSYGLIFVNSTQDLTAVHDAAKDDAYIIEPFVAGIEATCGVLEQADGTLVALPPVEIIPSEGVFDYEAKYIAKGTREICPGRFAPAMTARIQDQAVKAHLALSCSGYSRSDFIVAGETTIYLETNTLPGLTKASLFPKALNAHGIGFTDFLRGQIGLAEQRRRG